MSSSLVQALTREGRSACLRDVDEVIMMLAEAKPRSTYWMMMMRTRGQSL